MKDQFILKARGHMGGQLGRLRPPTLDWCSEQMPTSVRRAANMRSDSPESSRRCRSCTPLLRKIRSAPASSRAKTTRF